MHSGRGQATVGSPAEHGTNAHQSKTLEFPILAAATGSVNSTNRTMESKRLTERIKDLVAQQGFDHVGISRATTIERGNDLRRWLDAGRHGDMAYLERYLEQRLDPARVLPNARSVVVVALNYRQPAPRVTQDPAGRVAMYAWGEDYHVVIKDKLWAVVDALRTEIEEPFDAKPCVDTAPLLERELAMRSGIGWIGKNTLVLNRDLGSYFFLGEIVTTLDLVPDTPATDHCGTCTRCLDACPTDAFPKAYEMDASRCISYHTIELRDDIPEQFHAAIGDWLFGCDVCQQVCPFNGTTPATTEPRFAARAFAPAIAVDDVLSWDIEDYRKALSKTAVKRAKFEMLKRNAAIVLKNSIQT